MTLYLLLGFAVGVAFTIPIVFIATRTTASRIRRLEASANANARLAELGGMTSGLAHEIKNPLSTVGLNVQLIREDLDDLVRDGRVDEESAARLDRRFASLTHETHRLRDILEDFLRFAGRIVLDRRRVDVNAVVDELVDFFHAQAADAAVHLRTQLDADPAEVDLDADLFKQAMLNLMLNATQAMTRARQSGVAAGGNDELIVRTLRRVVDGVPEIHVHVIDTGPGIEPDKRDKIFTPYFSTRRGGTGLGLPTTRRIIEEHGGKITCHSEPGRGTDFQVVLPAAGEANETGPQRDVRPT